VYVLLDGDIDEPQVVDHDRVGFPSSSRGTQLSWLRKEVQEILERAKPTQVAFKSPEGNARTKDLSRAEVEGVLQEVATALDREPLRRVWSQIKADLKFQGSASELPTLLDTPGLERLPKNRVEAALAALAALTRA
jgi:hypothetical protein